MVPFTGPVTIVGIVNGSPSGSLSLPFTLKLLIVFSGTLKWSFTATGGLFTIGLSASFVVTTTMAVVQSCGTFTRSHTRYVTVSE